MREYTAVIILQGVVHSHGAVLKLPKLERRFTEEFVALFGDVARPRGVEADEVAVSALGKKKNLRTLFRRSWEAVIDHPNVKGALERLLFIPAREPDALQGMKLLGVLAHLRGEKTDLEFLDDLIECEARISEVSVETDSEGPTYHVKYTYGKGGDTYSHEIAQGYDIFHAAHCGWPLEKLNAYWSVGRTLPCRYSRSDPKKHAIPLP